MSNVQTLRAFVNQRLTVAAQEIFEMFERTIEDYEGELGRQRALLNAVFNPEVRLHKADTELMLLSEEKGHPEQQECRTSQDLEDGPEQPDIKKEQGDLWTTLEGEQLQGLEEANMTKFTFTPVHVKSEKDEKKPQSSQLHQSQIEEDEYSELVRTEAEWEDCGQPARTYNPVTHDKISHSPEPETDDSHDWEEIREHESNLSEVPVSYIECTTGKTVSSSECASSFGHKGHLQMHNEIQAGMKPFGCPVCGRRYPLKNSLKRHMSLHSEGKHFKCSVCNKSFPRKFNFELHMRIHTGERPYCCSTCGMRFSQKEHMRQHMRIHTGEKPFVCSVCGRKFAQSSALTRHSRLHTGERPFTCTFCKASFRFRTKLAAHMRLHDEEKPFSCSVCGKKFIQLSRLKKHKCVGQSSRSRRNACEQD